MGSVPLFCLEAVSQGVSFAAEPPCWSQALLMQDRAVVLCHLTPKEPWRRALQSPCMLVGSQRCATRTGTTAGGCCHPQVTPRKSSACLWWMLSLKQMMKSKLRKGTGQYDSRTRLARQSCLPRPARVFFNLKALRKSGDGSDMDGADARWSRRVPKLFP